LHSSTTITKTESHFFLLSISIVSVISVPLISFISYHDYPLVSAPVGLILLAIFGVGVISGIAEILGAYIVSGFLLSCALTLALDYTALDFLGNDGRTRLPALVLIFVAAFALNMRLRPNNFIIILVAFVAIGGAAILEGIIGISNQVPVYIGKKPEPPSGKHSRVILHLVLDEHIGLDGIPVDIEGGAETRALIEKFYLQHGFLLSSKAYSRYNDTADSISNMVNFDDSQQKWVHAAKYNSSGHIQVTENAYFEIMHSKGYNIHVYQADYLRYCDENTSFVAYCSTYNANSIKSIEPLAIDNRSKARFIVNSFLHESYIYKRSLLLYSEWLRPALFKSVDVRLPPWPKSGRRVGPIPAQKLLRDITADVLNSNSNRLVYAHLLTPHYPYIYDKNCKLRTPTSSWLDRKSSEPMLAVNNRRTREVRYSNYFEQLTCLYVELSDMLLAFASADMIDRITIIIQGDHGSRIGLNDPYENVVDSLVRDDLIDHFSTLWAVKGEGIDTGIDDTVKPLDRLLLETVAGSQDKKINHFFYLRRQPGRLHRIEGSPFEAMVDKFGQ